MIFSFDTLKKHSPHVRLYYQHVVKAEKTGDRDIKFTFDSPGNRELPSIVGQLTVLPKHWWEGTDAQGRKRDVTATTLEPPLGSGPYRIKDFVAGRSLVLERVKDYWGKDLPVSIGQNNFDELRYEFFRDDVVAPRGLQGRPGRLDRRAQRQGMGDGLRFPGGARQARDQGRVSDPQFRDACRVAPSTCGGRCSRMSRLRRAFNFAFDFEEMNKQLFYRRVQARSTAISTASRTCMATGLPQGEELEMLEAVARQGACRRSSPRPTRIRSAAIPKTSATICAKRRGC